VSGQVRSQSSRVRSAQVRSCPVTSGQGVSGQVRSSHVRTSQVRSMSWEVSSCQVRVRCVLVKSRSGQGLGRPGQSHVMIRSDQLMVWSGKVRSVTVKVKSRPDKGQIKVKSGQVRSGQVRSV